MPFVHLQVKSAYSLLTSAARLDRLVGKAKELQFKAMALTDFQVMYGAIAFYKLCQQHGIKPIMGLSIHVIDNDSQIPFVLLAENNDGYQNLIKISSALQTKSPEGLPKRWLKSYSRGLIAILPGQNVVNLDDAIHKVKEYQSIFGQQSFYLGFQLISKNEDDGPDHLVKLSNQTNSPLVAINDVCYIEKEDYLAHKCLQAIKNGDKLSDEKIDLKETKEHYLKSANDMVSLFEDYPDALENTLKIAERCCVNLDLGVSHLPTFPTPENQSADVYLEKLCYEGLASRLNNKDSISIYEQRLKYELSVIKRMNFSDYFLIVWDFMKYAHENKILTGPGRGSAAGSLVSYVLKITDVDPIQHRLLFERFLNPERISMPDIDIDFPDTRRDEVIAYVAKKYGKLHVAQIITFGTLAAKAAIRDVGRVMGASPKETDVLSKLIPSRPGISLNDAYKESETLQKAITESDLYKQIFKTALKIEGLPRHTSTHAAGVVLSDQPLTNIVPIQEGQQDVYLTQFSMDYLEDLGLLKMDFLGLRNLSLIENVITLIQRGEGKGVDLSDLPFQDEKTFRLLTKGDTTGVFQLESDGMRSVLKRLGPTTLEDIVAVNALYRPGPMENIPLYIERKHHKSDITYQHPALKPILQNTYGVIVYQEQIMEIASTMAGFSLGEADLLRRAVGKKKKEILDKEREHFVKGCQLNGYNLQVANSIYDLIVKFANYGFNRSHAVAYSMIAYQLAFLKAHFPLYFWTALLTSVNGNEDKVAQYVREAKQIGISILPPSINKSAFPFLVERKAIRFSLSGIKNVGVAAVKEIFHARKQKTFEDLFDFCIRVSMKIITRRTMEQLIFAGAMDEFGVDRATLLASLDVAIEHAELMTPSDDQHFDLFLGDEFNLKPKYIEVEPFKTEEKLRYEKESLGFYFSSHPVEVVRKKLIDIGATTIDQLPSKIDRKVSIGGMIGAVRTIRTKKGEVMAFLSLGDETGEIDAVIFPQTYTKFSEKTKDGLVFLFGGKVEKRQDKIQFIIQQIIDTNDLPELPQQEKLFIKIEKQSAEQNKLIQVKEMLKSFHGKTPVFLHYENEKRTIQLPEEFFIHASDTSLDELMKLLGKENVVLMRGKGDR
ncbi:DNA polymerase III subunit alpha [Metabacillus halosaccharovorans]|uniref:DNA polymerase III subunit alpha n=1 Tax=Metabacillus halosaccharovorans TaxID=930124 RepID=UPI00203E281A|nr:DNA polymerase III subunit alpha [Metabacillus halosaccharovorans]MCM3442795.1 DNA polymerase III subunit alpha [Metabacillus halosaccharovorans]